MATKYYGEISGNREEISFKYQNFASSVEEMYALLSANISREKICGFSTIGVQREDIEININGEPSKDFASQGQQRSIVLSIKLSESDIFKNVTETNPVVLLDDVLSELDYLRQEYLLKNIEGKQVFISSCDEDRIKVANCNKYYVKEGAINQCM